MFSGQMQLSAPKSTKSDGILIVDDDREITHLVRILLERTGDYLVFEENDSTKAHQSARNFRPHVILIDVVMPIRDGGEVAAQSGVVGS